MAPDSHGIVLRWWSSHLRLQVWRLAWVFAPRVMSLMLRFRIPERWSPGSFDLWVNNLFRLVYNANSILIVLLHR